MDRENDLTAAGRDATTGRTVGCLASREAARASADSIGARQRGIRRLNRLHRLRRLRRRPRVVRGRARGRVARARDRRRAARARARGGGGGGAAARRGRDGGCGHGRRRRRLSVSCVGGRFRTSSPCSAALPGPSCRPWNALWRMPCRPSCYTLIGKAFWMESRQAGRGACAPPGLAANALGKTTMGICAAFSRVPVSPRGPGDPFLIGNHRKL